jgi:hypothetical protein
VENAWFAISEPIFVRLEPLLIRVFQRRGERRHDLAAVAQVSANFCPTLLSANRIEATFIFNEFLQFVQIQRPLVDAWKSVEVGTGALLVELCELIEVVEVGSCT